MANAPVGKVIGVGGGVRGVDPELSAPPPILSPLPRMGATCYVL